MLFKKESYTQFFSIEYSQTTPKEYIAVIDTETTWSDRVMSIGVVIAEKDTFAPVEYRYFVLKPEYREGGMYSFSLVAEGIPTEECSREKAVRAIKKLLEKYNTEKICAYNARFDYNHLPELQNFRWHDIMRLAAYKQFNKSIPPYADFCSTGRLKRGFGVEPIYRMLSGNIYYTETHNAINDAIDELYIMRMLGHHFAAYEQVARIN